MGERNPYRQLPSVDRLLADERVRALANGEAEAVTDLVRAAVATARAAISEGREAPSEEQLVECVLGLAETVLRPSLRPVINATGVIIHTNLGRAPLSEDAIEAMVSVSHGYSNLEFNLEAGERGSRASHLEAALRQLTGAEAVVAVNNNAAALLLVLSVLCVEREVIISRGQAVEIGGGFRIPDVMREAGVRLVEVGTTNRTYLRDYEGAISERTAAVMRVHASNFRIVGFTESPPLQGMARVAHEHGALLFDDIGSGCLLDPRPYGLTKEPTVQESVAAGADLTLFSGDKLLGGPQAGIIAGRAPLIDQLKLHPLMRALRLDKAAIAGLHATLLHYLRGEAIEKVPVWRMISMPLPAIDGRAQHWAQAIGPIARIVDGRSMVGGGSLPEESLPTKLMAIERDAAWVSGLARRLRADQLPVVARIERDKLLFDPRTVLPEQDEALLMAVKSALAQT
jgi:L-seryl-tRNA(Ser) seleniumtransferase